MSNMQILPNELAEIVSGLLINPDLLGELDSPERYHSFFLDIGRVVAEHCGGEADWVNAGADSRPRSESVEYDVPSLSVSPNDSLPSLERNVWSLYDDPDAWAAQQGMLPCNEPYTDQEVHSLRLKLQGLLVMGNSAESNILARTKYILSELLDSSDLDLDYQVGDLIESFDDYDWQPASDSDKRKFELLLAKGNQQRLTEDECFDFLALVDRDSQSHLAHKIVQAKVLLDTLEVMCEGKQRPN